MIIPMKLNERLLKKKYSNRLRNRPPVLDLKNALDKQGLTSCGEVVVTPIASPDIDGIYRLYPTESTRIRNVRIYINPWRVAPRRNNFRGIDQLMRENVNWPTGKVVQAFYSWVSFYIAAQLSKEFPFEHFIAKSYAVPTARGLVWCLAENGEIVPPKNSDGEFLYDRYGIFCLAPQLIKRGYPEDPKLFDPIRKYFEDLPAAKPRRTTVNYKVTIQNPDGTNSTLEMPAEKFTDDEAAKLSGFTDSYTLGTASANYIKFTV